MTKYMFHPKAWGGLALACIALLLGCCKSETYYVDQAVKDYTVFPVGSWWVYVDSVSGRQDSVVWTSSKSSVSASNWQKCDDRYEEYYQQFDLYTLDTNQVYKLETIESRTHEVINAITTMTAKDNGTSSGLGKYDRNTGEFQPSSPISESILSFDIRVIDTFIVKDAQILLICYKLINGVSSYAYYQERRGCIKYVMFNESQKNTLSSYELLRENIN